MSEDTDMRGQTLLRLIKQGEKYRDERFGKTAKELEVYDYTDKVIDDITWDDAISFKIKVRKTSQFKREIGARLFNANPTFRSNAQPWSTPVSQTRAAIMEAYLNYCKNENDLFDTLEDTLINGGLGFGLGVVWTGLHPDKEGVVTCADDSWHNLVLDPDAKKWSQLNWVARRRFKARWWLMQRYPEHKSQIKHMTGRNRRSEDDDDDSADTSTEMVCFYEIWMRTGLHHYKDGADSEDLVDEPRKYIVSSDGTILFEGDWETPLHLDGRWPCVPLVFYKHPEEVWPISPLEPGLSWLKGMNVVATMLIAKYRVCNGRTIIALLQANGSTLSEEDQDKILYGNNPVEVIFPKLNAVDNNPDVRQAIQTITLQSDLSADMAVFAFLAENFEKETGLYEFLYTGQTDKQDRSAFATQMREQNTRSRIDYMQTKLDHFLSQLGRQLALTARYHLTGEDIAPFLGEEAGEAWGMLMGVEDMDPDRILSELIEDGVPYEMALMQAQEIIAQGTSYDEWRNEIDYGIEIGSTVRKSPEAEREANEMAIQQVVPIMLQTGLFAAAGEFLAKQGELSGLTIEQVDLIRDSLRQLQEMQQPQEQPIA